MAQTKVFGLKEELSPIRGLLSDTIHSCVMDALEYPPDKRFHRFLPLEREDFVHSPDRSDRYTIIEVSMFKGRSADAKRTLIRLLYERIRQNPRHRPARRRDNAVRVPDAELAYPRRCRR